MKPNDRVRWGHVPNGGGWGYASPVVTVMLVPPGRKVKIEAMTKDGGRVFRWVDKDHLHPIDGGANQ